VTHKPLPEELRPSVLSELVGQDNLTGTQGIITKLIVSIKSYGSVFPSLILWGPPGCGKTTLARIIANELGCEFAEFSAVNASVKDIEKVIGNTQIKKTLQPTFDLNLNKKTQSTHPIIIFLDEIHRFNKAQQDSLLPHVEKGTIILIGATTENPSFEVISPLLSRCRVVVLNRLDLENLKIIIERGVQKLGVRVDVNCLDFLAESANGDARVALNVLEIASQLATNGKITVKTLEQALQRKQLNFDLKGEEFYNTISALHKSIRGSDPDAALYWLARMLEAGQDPIYIARRLIRCASEDIGMADPNALTLAVSAFSACEKIGVPECNLALAETVVYLATAPKSNALYMSYGEVAEDVKNFGNLPVPLHIRNAPTKLMKDLGYSKGYDYTHSATGQKSPEIDYLPDELKDRKYFSKRHKIKQN
jgi:putative ATPase